MQHDWDGCKCSKCGKTRDEQHDWSDDCEKCSKCGKIRSEQHAWIKNKCSKCGKTQNTCTIIYFFNSDIIIDEVSSNYGGYAEEELLKAISTVLEPEGGWKSLPALVEACYGDLIERPIWGSSRVEIFRNWLNTGKYGANRKYFDSNAINKDSNLGYIPYVIGINNIYTYQALATHQLLKNNNIKGYQGLCILDQTFNFSKLSDELSLVPDMVDRGEKYSLWWSAQH